MKMFQLVPIKPVRKRDLNPWMTPSIGYSLIVDLAYIQDIMSNHLIWLVSFQHISVLGFHVQVRPSAPQGPTTADLEDKYKRVMMTNAQLDNEKQMLSYQVDLLKEQLDDAEEQYLQLEHQHSNSRRVRLFKLYKLVISSNLFLHTWEEKDEIIVKLRWFHTQGEMRALAGNDGLVMES